MIVSRLTRRVSNCGNPYSCFLLHRISSAGIGFSSLSTAAADSSQQSTPTSKPTSLSARMSFIFDQIDQIDKQREEKDQTLQRIRAWRESKKRPSVDSEIKQPDSDTAMDLQLEMVKGAFSTNSNDKKEVAVELEHPWPEWIELMERLVKQNYFDHRRKDEDGMMEGLGFDLSENSSSADDKVSHFMRDFKTVQTAVINFGRDRFDILRSLSRQDLQVLVGYGCPSADKRVVFSSKLLRKHVHLDEGDVCSSCSLRNSCEKAYLLTNKEDEARTIDVMRILLAYGFDPIDGSVVNKPLLKKKSVRTVVKKLIHEVVKLSAVPIDPNLPPPVIKKPPPKVKQPPPPPKKRVGRNDVEMKKGDWLCPKCDFMNFAKNTVCLQCDAKRPKRQLLPGEWECPQCNFLNYRRNTECFHCEVKRPSDTYVENQFPERQRGLGMKMDKAPNRASVSSSWNFDFDDNESDGADVAAFEYADSQRLDEDFPSSKLPLHQNSRGGSVSSRNNPEFSESHYSDLSPTRPGIGFNDFDEDEDDVDSYELVSQTEAFKTSQINFSELEADSDSDDIESTASNQHARVGKTSSPTRSKKKSLHSRSSFSDSEDIDVEFNSDDDLPVHPKWKSSHVADWKQRNKSKTVRSFDSDDDDDDDLVFGSGTGEETLKSKRGRQGYNRSDRTTARGRSSFGPSTDSDDNFGSYRDKQRDQGGRARPRNASSYRSDRTTARGRSNFGPTTDSDDDFGSYRDKQRDQGGRARPRNASRSRGGKIGQNNDFAASSRFQRNNERVSENTRDDSFSKKRGSFDKQRGKSMNSGDQFDNYLNDERYRRPRINVR